MTALFFLFRKIKVGGLHPERVDDNQKGDVGIHLGNDTIIARIGKDISVKRNEQIIEKATEYTAQAVDGRLACKFPDRAQSAVVSVADGKAVI